MSLFEVKEKVPELALIVPGWSLTADLAQWFTKQMFSIGVGDVYKLCQPSVLYHADTRWWKFHHDKILFNLPKVSMSVDDPRGLKTAEEYGVDYLINGLGRQGFDMRPGHVVQGICSLCQAMNLAVHYRPERIFLVGVDLCPHPETDDNHFDGDHPVEIQGEGKKHPPFEQAILRMGSRIPFLEELGIKVYNCSHTSALECFPKVDPKCLPGR